MNCYLQVGKAVANFPVFFADVGKLANACQLEITGNQMVTDQLASWQLASAANLPTAANPHECWVSTPFPVGENSPSYYVGEGTAVPSALRGGLSGGREIAGHPVCGTSILALDLGTQTGWALLDREGAITSGSELFKPQRFEGGGMRYLRFKRWITEVKQSADGLNAVFFEEVRRHAGVDAAHTYGGFMAHLTAWCEHHQIPYQGVPVGTIKKHATGKGNASKDEMTAAARLRGHVPADDNEADALALLHWAVEHGGWEA
jgi:Holliday junction resolvasome RuvABC endonuclease subunit